jgi:MYXO-CTERM domain-containing protein
VVVRSCFPRPQACQDDRGCAAGSVCFDFADSTRGYPEFWPAGSPTRSCLPEGLALALRGHADFSGPALVLVDSATPNSAEGGGSGPGLGNGGPAATVPKADGRGCAIGSEGSPAAGGLATLAGLALLVVRRRRRV